MQRTVPASKKGTAFGLATLLLAAGSWAAPADTVFIGENIVTLREANKTSGDGTGEPAEPSALAIDGDRIVWMGPSSEAKAWIGTETEVIDLKGNALLPGFIDAHGHLLFSASTLDFANVSSPPVGEVTDFKSLQQTLRRHIGDKQIPKGEWVIGFGYDDSLLRESRHPEKEDLDAASSEHPVVLLHVSGHLFAANSLALSRVGYTAASPDPEGGHIRRKPGSREPNGVLEETATKPLQGAAQPKWNADLIKRTLVRYASYGITTVQDGATDPAGLGLLQSMAAQGVLTLDTVAYVLTQFASPGTPLPSASREYTNGFRVGGVKLLLDGSPQGKTAWLSKPYHVPPPGKSPDYRGYPIMAQEITDSRVDEVLGRDVQLIAHANGDAAIDSLLDAVEKSLAGRKSMPDHRTVMIHAQTVREDQLDRMRTLGVMPSYFSAHSFFWGDWHRDSVLGERAFRISPLRSTIDREIPFTVHNDAPVVPPDMIRLLWATTNRQTRSGKVLGEEQRISVRDALLAITRNAAWQYFEEDSKGSLETGKRADLVLLSENPLNMKPEDLLRLKVLGTWSRGIRVFAAQ